MEKVSRRTWCIMSTVIWWPQIRRDIYLHWWSDCLNTGYLPVHRLLVSNFGQYYQYYTNLINVFDDSDWQQNRTDIEMAKHCPTVSHSTEQYHHVKEDTMPMNDSRMVSSQPDTSSWTNFILVCFYDKRWSSYSTGEAATYHKLQNNRHEMIDILR